MDEIIINNLLVFIITASIFWVIFIKHEKIKERGGKYKPFKKKLMVIFLLISLIVLVFEAFYFFIIPAYKY